YGVAIALLPLIIVTHMIERFWTVEAEDSLGTAFKILLGTVTVATVVSLAVSPNVVPTTLFRYPETLGLVLAGQFLIGRYTGYRLTELFRFRDVLVEESFAGVEHELAESH